MQFWPGRQPGNDGGTPVSSVANDDDCDTNSASESIAECDRRYSSSPSVFRESLFVPFRVVICVARSSASVVDDGVFSCDVADAAHRFRRTTWWGGVKRWNMRLPLPEFQCGKGCTWHWSSAKVGTGGVGESRIESQLFHLIVAAGLTYTQLNNLLTGFGMKEVRKETFYNFFHDEGKGLRQWLRHVERVTQRSFDRVIALLRHSRDPVVVLVDDRYDSSRDAQHCTVSAVDLKSGMLVGTKTMERGGESFWRLETQCVERLLQRLKDEKNLIIVEVVHDDCGAVDVVLRCMNIDSQKCMWHKVKALIKRLREVVRATKTVKPGAVGACAHVREVKCFTKKELGEWLESRGVRVEAVGAQKKDEVVELVWVVLFPDQVAKPLSDDAIEIDALEMLHSHAAEEAKKWLYAACRLRKSAGDDDGDLLATHVQHLANHWAGDQSLCEKELPNLCKAAGGHERAALYEKGGRVHSAISCCLQQFASNTKMAYYTRARITFNNKCFHSVINKYATKRLNFTKSYEARVCCTALEWNKNKAIKPVRSIYRRPTNVTHRRRSAIRHVYGTQDTSWRFDIAAEVFGTGRVGDWARYMLQQRDVEDPIFETVDDDADFGLSVDDEDVAADDGALPSSPPRAESSDCVSSNDDASSTSDAAEDTPGDEFVGPVLS
ncbi:hypothetical protein CBR_g34551 [Chara braunii]|uniref:Uncharacterized protein n=1 Tax=Chara braunii TaxID=69332 RepID=A0A388LJ21_CHABU|nr:hypothetical protein CBR_g34551 [Chara braunii]|eukprot:GBG82267.1 hypothetical protein CBR_g34551 [Chara braunii]